MSVVMDALHASIVSPRSGFTSLKSFEKGAQKWETLKQWRSHWGGKGGRVPPLTAKICQKSGKNQENRKKIRQNREKRGKIGKKRQNWEVSFTLPLLTDRAGYATALKFFTLVHFAFKGSQLDTFYP